jgi:hypothetical protein
MIKTNNELKASSLRHNPANPRVITDDQLAALKSAMIEFGDLSGLVVNLTTGNLVGGHQRVKILGDAPIKVLQRYPKQTPQGTVAEGFALYKGERFVYREVRWHEQKEKAAMIAANKHSGEFDHALVRALLLELNSADYDLSLTGFFGADLEAMLEIPHKDKERGGLLALVNVTLDEPTIQVEAGDTWRAGPHAIICLDVMIDWHLWIDELKEGDMLLPYAGPLILLTEKAKTTRFVIIQPDQFICGLMLDKFVEAKLGQPTRDE